MSKALSLYINTILFVFVASLCLAGTRGVPYQELRTNFKQKMFERQQGIMDQEKYMAFIEPYIEEAEKNLQIPQYLMQNKKSKLSEQYFECLLNYNVAFLHAYAKTYSNARKDVVRYEQALQESIEHIKAEGKLEDLDAQQEFIHTKKLFDRASRRFYKKLGIGARIYNFFRTVGR